MYRCGFFLCSLWLSTSALVARMPVEATKPTARGNMPVAGCDACRFLPPPSRVGPIVPVQDGPILGPRDAVPEPLPPSVDATPLPPADAEYDLRMLIELSLPEATEDERNVWLEELRSLPLPTARAILSARVGSGLSPDLGASPVVPEPTDEWPDHEVPQQSEPALPRLAPPLRTIRPRTSSTSPEISETLVTLRQVETVLLHNIANALTPGFKRLQPLTTEAAGVAGVSGIVVRRAFTQGLLHITESPFDVALDGPGFLQVRHGDTVALTRGGRMTVTDSHELALDVSGKSWTLHPPVAITDDAAVIVFTPEGVVGFHDAGGDFITTGRLQLVRVPDPSQLEPVDGGLLAVPESTGPVVIGVPGEHGFGRVKQGRIEASNVDLDTELQTLRNVRSQIAAFDETVPSQLATPTVIDDRHGRPVGGEECSSP